VVVSYACFVVVVVVVENTVVAHTCDLEVQVVEVVVDNYFGCMARLAGCCIVV
jgi:hypothetical protein